MKTKFLLLPVLVVILILENSCRKTTEAIDDNDCVKVYQERMKEIKESKEKAIQNCQHAGGTGVAECIARVTSESEKLEKAALEEYKDCVGK